MNTLHVLGWALISTMFLGVYVGMSELLTRMAEDRRYAYLLMAGAYAATALSVGIACLASWLVQA